MSGLRIAPQYYSGVLLSYPMPTPQTSDPNSGINETIASSSSSASEESKSEIPLDQESSRPIVFATFGKEKRCIILQTKL